MIAEVINILQGYEFIHLPRPSRGGGVGLILKKGFKVKENPVTSFNTLESMNITISSNEADFRLVIVYRPPPSKKNKLTPSMFF